MNAMFRALRLCGACVTAAVFFVGTTGTPARAADDLPIIGDIPMPQVDVDVRLDDDDLPPPPRPRLIDPRRPLAAIAPARFAPPMEEFAVAPVEVARMLRSTGYSLLGRIDRRGWVYTVAVLNPRGDDGRAVIDARTGAIIRFIPAGAVNARLNSELGVIYGPPGPPPVVQDVRSAPRPPKPIRRVTKRDVAPNGLAPKGAAPKVADRIPANPPKPGNPADAHAELKSTSVSKPPASKPPELKLWPTAAMPDVQPLD